ncbi:MAG: hypothetical protein D6689_17965 [Deltaproteobacteria bacterium]|nr:MAG: hypothetical protein D6689_17965 [Deltaproteobacteria bacterium]
MKIDKERKLFFGYKIDSKLREALANATPGDRHYFEDPDSDFLRICSAGDERWIGKVMKCGITTADVEDVQRNVVSILRRIAPNIRHSPTQVKIFAIADETPEADPLPAGDRPDDDGGPYIV